ncbi:MAG: hypothetical protein DWQ44_08800 [Bacteroidetes bacterium]|nr:MAG: hypothetical protein DWQ44_08800 [Bacteroidota bacterium]
MKSRIILLIIGIFLATPAWMRISWEFTPKRVLNLLIVDKTVLNKNSLKHRSVNWILDHEKYIKADGKYYEITEDYYGFFPGENEKYEIRDLDNMDEAEVDSVSYRYNMVYYTDTYGVAANEWYRHRDVNDRSENIYGGMTEKDMLLLKKMKQKKKMIIAEFNSIAYPTTSAVRKDFEQTFGIEWSGWIARHIASLDTINNPDLPKWVVRTHKQKNNGIWDFKNAGLIFVHESGDVVILEEGRDLNESVPKIYTEKRYQDQYNVPPSLIYPYWIDIMVNKNDSNEVISRYIIGTNRSGEKKLIDKRIPKVFPSIIRRTGDYKFYYFCGDYADNPTKFRFAKLNRINNLKFLMYNAVDVTDRNRFFWEFYLPMMQSIFRDVYLTSSRRLR